MKKTLLSLIVALLFCFNTAKAFNVIGAYLSLSNDTLLVSVSPAGVPTFSVSGINDIIAKYTVTGFYHSFPNANSQFLRESYTLRCTDSNLANELKTTYPQYFLLVELIYEAIPTSIINTGLQTAINIFPNPASNFIHIKCDEINVKHVSIQNITGSLITNLSLQESQNSIDISGYKSGVYFIKAYDVEEHLLGTIRFLKQ